MESKKIIVNGKEYLFINESKGSRNGFKHCTTLLINNNEVVDVAIQYYNRTWETYRYRTSMNKAIQQMINCRKSRLEMDFRRDNDIYRMTKKRRAELDDILYADSLLNEYIEVRNLL